MAWGDYNFTINQLYQFICNKQGPSLPFVFSSMIRPF